MSRIMTEPIRVLQTTSSMNRGGIETMLMNYYSHLDRSKIQFDFLLTGDRHFDYEPQITELGGKIFKIPKLGYRTFPSFILGLNKFFKSNNHYTIVHSHWNAFNGLLLFFAKKNGIKNRISHSHIAKRSPGIYGIIQIIFKSLIKYSATVNLSCGDEAAHFLYGRNSKYILFNNAIDIDKFKFNKLTRNTLRTNLNIDQDTIVIGHVGRFMEQKNHKFIIKIFNEYLKINDNSILLLVGKGPLMEEINAIIKQYQLENKVFMIGNVPNVNEYLQVMDVFLFPSLYEGLSVSIIEAQASGLQVFSSDRIDPKSKVTPHVHFLSLNQPASEWALQIKSLLKLIKRDESANLVKAADYDIMLSAKKLQNFYLSLDQTN